MRLAAKPLSEFFCARLAKEKTSMSAEVARTKGCADSRAPNSGCPRSPTR